MKNKSKHDLTITKSKVELTQSGINMYMKCPEQFNRRYIQGDIIPPSVAMACGSSVHIAAQFNFEHKLTTGQDEQERNVVEVGVESLKQGIQRDGLFLSEEEASKGTDAILNDAQRKVQSLATLFRREVAPPLMPRLVEHEHVFALPSGVTMKAHLDMETTDRVILELKTKAKSGNISDYEKSIQTTMYHMVSALVEGTPPKAVVVEELIDTKTPKRQQFVLKKGRDDYEAVLNQVDAVAKAVKSGSFTGAYGQQGAWWCSKDRCGYWRSCLFVPKNKRG